MRFSRPLESSAPGEDAAEVVADGAEHDIGGIASAALEIAAARRPSVFRSPIKGSMADRRLSSRLITRRRRASGRTDEDAAWILRVMVTVSLIEIGRLDRTSGQSLGILDYVA
jgi:hypothetical protein